MNNLRLTEAIRERVRKPLGKLVTGSPENAMLILKDIISRENPIKLFAVGDFVTSNMIRYGINADIFVIDNKIMRKPIENTSIKGRKIINACNPPGMITSEAWDVVKRGVEDSVNISIIIDGEEDLLTLPIIKLAPIGTVVVYGQPNMGLVIVRVTNKKKEEIEYLIDRMESV